MSLDSLFYVGLLFGSYKLGKYQASNPGELERLAKLAWEQLCESLRK